MAAQESIYTCSRCAQAFAAYTQLEAEVLHKACSPRCDNTSFAKTKVKQPWTKLYEKVEASPKTSKPTS